MRRADTDNTAGAPPPPALKGAAPAAGGAGGAARAGDVPGLKPGGVFDRSAPSRDWGDAPPRPSSRRRE